jgi:hypothetical protein
MGEGQGGGNMAMAERELEEITVVLIVLDEEDLAHPCKVPGNGWSTVDIPGLE